MSCVYSEPPVPTTAPKLLEKSSKQLVVMPVESFRGDGPVISTRVLYKPVKSDNAWSSIIGMYWRLRHHYRIMDCKPYHGRINITSGYLVSSQK